MRIGSSFPRWYLQQRFFSQPLSSQADMGGTRAVLEVLDPSNNGQRGLPDFPAWNWCNRGLLERDNNKGCESRYYFQSILLQIALQAHTVSHTWHRPCRVSAPAATRDVRPWRCGCSPWQGSGRMWNPWVALGICEDGSATLPLEQLHPCQLCAARHSLGTPSRAPLSPPSFGGVWRWAGSPDQTPPNGQSHPGEASIGGAETCLDVMQRL